MRLTVTGLLLLLGPFAACQDAPSEAHDDAAPATDATIEPTCGGLGVLQGTLSGAINARLDWPDDALRCESMPRPDAEGVRLRLSGDVAGERVAIIIAMPGLEPGATRTELSSNVTITVEGSGRFFSTPNLETCWTDVVKNEPLQDMPDMYVVMGDLYCVGPLGEINGDAFVDVRMLRFSSVANWSVK
ncbi:MAG: hypothetical protein OEU59_04765 [Gammaproteobacteria bacterium]|nr:hypothetical protein [Gammaproteobacteria bacterium]